jgi:hypothetical protein
MAGLSQLAAGTARAIRANARRFIAFIPHLASVDHSKWRNDGGPRD